MIRSSLVASLWLTCSLASLSAASVRPDIVVAADGTGDFKTIQAAVESIPNTNRERKIVFIKDGVYREKVRVGASFVTLRGQSRKGTRIEFAQLNDDFTRKPDDLGRAVINLNRADDFVLENLTAENTAGVIGPHAFTIYGTGDRTVIVDCDVLSDGADTVSLWLGERGRYYHANCNFRGSVDFVCPRGWCYATNCTFYEMKNTAAVWHDGVKDRDMKFVMRHCRFDGTNGWNLARHHHDAQFYFLDCTFSKTMIDRAPFRVIYPLDGSTPSDADIRRNKELDSSNIWGERSYFFNSHREGGDYGWLDDNLSSATNSPSPKAITAAWTFAGKWDPERTVGPVIRKILVQTNQIALVFSESVTVKGRPRLEAVQVVPPRPNLDLASERVGVSDYLSGSGSDTLLFSAASWFAGSEVLVNLNGGAIIACEAGASLLEAKLSLPTN
jgi:pectinesterase